MELLTRMREARITRAGAELTRIIDNHDGHACDAVAAKVILDKHAAVFAVRDPRIAKTALVHAYWGHTDGEGVEITRYPLGAMAVVVNKNAAVEALRRPEVARISDGFQSIGALASQTLDREMRNILRQGRRIFSRVIGSISLSSALMIAGALDLFKEGNFFADVAGGTIAISVGLVAAMSLKLLAHDKLKESTAPFIAQYRKESTSGLSGERFEEMRRNARYN